MKSRYVVATYWPQGIPTYSAPLSWQAAYSRMHRMYAEGARTVEIMTARTAALAMQETETDSGFDAFEPDWEGHP
jgi:hypothetical protein